MGLFKLIGIALLLILIVGALMFFGIIKVEGDYLRINLKNKSPDNSTLVKIINESCINNSEVCLINVSNYSGS